jgi:hypothetical protein
VLDINPSIVQAVLADYKKVHFLIIHFVDNFVKHVFVYLTYICMRYLCLGREERETRAKSYLTALVHSLYPCCNQEMAEILI